jgi:Acetyltransferases
VYREFQKKDFLWIKKVYEDFSVENPYLKGIILENKEKIGFILYEDIYDRAEIIYIYIFPDYRANGYGEKLLSNIFNILKDKKNITLEVSINNSIAINLYKKLDFKIAATREKYYQNEDAYLMVREM